MTTLDLCGTLGKLLQKMQDLIPVTDNTSEIVEEVLTDIIDDLEILMKQLHCKI